MALLLVPLSAPASEWLASFRSEEPALEVRVWPEVGDPADIDVLAVGIFPPGGLGTLPNLRLIASLLAGQDLLLRSPHLPRGVPVVRAASPAGDRMMTHTVLLHVLRHHQDMPHYALAQQRREWAPLRRLRVEERTVGVAGLGLLGAAAARTLATFGFQVRGWSRREHSIEGVDTFHGPDELPEFLSRCEIVVNLLALTPETRDLFRAETLAFLPRGAALINLSRGEHIVEADLLAALRDGGLSFVTLDAFRTEPLPADSPLWTHERVTITPHVARRLLPSDLVPSICENVRRLSADAPLLHRVDAERGY